MGIWNGEHQLALFRICERDMTDYEKLLSLIDDERVKAGLSLNKEIGKTFTLGQTRYVWRHGTLGDGHEHFGPFRYFQAKREIYHLSNSIEDSRYNGMEANADLLDAEFELNEAKTEAETLRASAKLGRAKAKLRRSLDTVQDSLRGLDEVMKVKQELEPEVMRLYPDGIEQAEPEHWKTVFEYRAHKQKHSGAFQPVDSIPLEPSIKAALGQHYGRGEAILAEQIEKAHLQIADESQEAS